MLHLYSKNNEEFGRTKFELNMLHSRFSFLLLFRYWMDLGVYLFEQDLSLARKKYCLVLGRLRMCLLFAFLIFISLYFVFWSVCVCVGRGWWALFNSSIQIDLPFICESSPSVDSKLNIMIKLKDVNWRGENKGKRRCTVWNIGNDFITTQLGI